MALYGAAQGYNEFVQQDQQRQYLQALLKAYATQQQQQQRQQAARGPAMEQLMALANQQGPGAGTPQLTMPQAPAPGTPSTPMMQPGGGPGAGMPGTPAGPTVMPPYKALPNATQSMPGGPPAGPPQISPPPAGGPPAATPGGAPGTTGAPAETTGAQGVTQPNINIRAYIQQLSRAGIPPDKAMDILEEAMPTLSAQNTEELNSLRGQLSAQKAALDAYQKAINEQRATDTAKHQKAQEDQAAAGLQEKKREADQKNQTQIQSIRTRMQIAQAKLKATGQTGDKTVVSQQMQFATKLISEINSLTNRAITEPDQGKAAQMLARADALQTELDNTMQQAASRIPGAGSTAQPETGKGKPQPTQKDRDWVKAHPEDKAKFVQQFGTEP